MSFHRSEDDEVEPKKLYSILKLIMKQKEKTFSDGVPDRYKLEDYHIISFNPNR